MWFNIINQQVELKIFAKPNAKRTALLKVDEEALHISLHAKPHEGEANKELISFLAKLFRIPKSQIILQRGESGRRKIMMVPLSVKVQEFIDNPFVK
jgi:uncharacterized protein (TIGR00251 family)